MIPGGALLIALAACLFLIASAIWADRRFAGYERLPRQFGFSLKPIAYGPRWVIVWFVPLLLVAVIAFAAFAPTLFSPDSTSGEPGTGVIVASLAGVAAQVFVLWLLVRWARGQS